jgi:hypothetical protein
MKKQQRYWAITDKDGSILSSKEGLLFIFDSRDESRAWRKKVKEYHATKEAKITLIKK